MPFAAGTEARQIQPYPLVPVQPGMQPEPRASTIPRTPAGPPRITPVLPLLLLQTIRDLDRPAESLEDEIWAESIPRRLGLSPVVDTQIRRWEGEVRAKTLHGENEVEDLIRLVMRRPDADDVFREAGRRVARWAWNGRSRMLKATLEALPQPFSKQAARAGVRRLFLRLVGNAELRVGTRPFRLQISPSLTARADPGGVACDFYGAAFGDLLRQYTDRPYRIAHTDCEARGAERCVWTAEPEETG